MADEFTGFRIAGLGGKPVAYMKLRHPIVQIIGPNHYQVLSEVVMDEPALKMRIVELEMEGQDVSLKRSALAGIRIARHTISAHL